MDVIMIFLMILRTDDMRFVYYLRIQNQQLNYITKNLILLIL